jgi:hypothetical protein
MGKVDYGYFTDRIAKVDYGYFTYRIAKVYYGYFTDRINFGYHVGKITSQLWLSYGGNNHSQL